MNPDLAVAYVSRGAAHGELGNLQQAIYNYDKAIDLDPSLAAAYASRGQAERIAELSGQ